MEVGSLSRICLKVLADLELSIAAHEALTNRFESFNLKLLLRFGVLCIDPTSERIVQDNLDLPRVLGEN